MEPAKRTLLIAAHPDDEIIGAGVWMSRQPPGSVIVVHLTDGSPRDLQDAHDAGFETREAYAEMRRKELHAALGLAGVLPTECVLLDCVDKEAYLHLTDIAEQLAVLLRAMRPDLILSPPYEGGHPDHDGAAFTVHEALRITGITCEHREYTLYHSGPGRMITGEFLPGSGIPEEVIEFSPREQKLKKAMIDCFRSQKRILSVFGTERERFRRAPSYDFTRAPHDGQLQYEFWGFQMTGADWRRRAAEAGEQLSRKTLVSQTNAV